MPREVKGYRCTCNDCLKRKHCCSTIYSSYQSAYNHERYCPMAESHKTCATCKFKNYKRENPNDINLPLLPFCEKGLNDSMEYQINYQCEGWEIDKKRKEWKLDKGDDTNG